MILNNLLDQYNLRINKTIHLLIRILNRILNLFNRQYQCYYNIRNYVYRNNNFYWHSKQNRKYSFYNHNLNQYQNNK